MKQILFDKIQKKWVWLIIIASKLAIISLFLDNFFNDRIHLIHNPTLDIVFTIMTNFYLLIFVLLFVTTFFMYAEKKREGIIPVWASLLITTVVVVLLKLLIARERPQELTDVAWFMYSFPSLHAALCFTVLPTLDIEFPKHKWAWISLAALVGLSRIYLQVHYLSDVLAGCAIGYAIGVWIFHLNKKYYYKIKW